MSPRAAEYIRLVGQRLGTQERLEELTELCHRAHRGLTEADHAEITAALAPAPAVATVPAATQPAEGTSTP